MINMQSFISFSSLRTVSLIGDNAKGFYLPLFIYSISNGNIALVGLVYMFDFLPRLFLIPFFGNLADSKNCLWIIRSLESSRVFLLFVWYIFYSFPYIWLISPIITVSSGILMVFYETTASRILDEKQMIHFQTKSQLLEPAARLIGPMLIGASLTIFNNRNTIFIIILSYILTFFINIKTIKIERIKVNFNNFSKKLINLSVFKFHLSNKYFLMITLAEILLNLFFGVFQTLLIPIMRTHYQTSESLSTLPNILGGIISLLLAYFIPKIMQNKSKIFFAYMGSFCLLMSAILIASDLGRIFFSFAFGLLITGSSLFGIFFRIERVKLIPAEKLGNIFGANTSILLISAPLAGGVVYLLEKYFSSLVMLIILSFFCSINIIFILFIYQKRMYTKEKAYYLKKQN
ncbi:hypothetical protein [Fluviispira sanaruensis]|uniref:MFS transporter n=1 Tax=Fluviispira sanaruensis TaxID=2493639 RepID=A0A4P2VFV7_FLUSA|nr:hypothetical protein [Fluviispira sanaruensis]BBH51703.1 MFS transporter [Fluviispira sanaruensis]